MKRREFKMLFAGGTGGGGTLTIRFEIVEPIFCEACSGTGRIISRPPGGGTLPGEEYGEVTIYDFSGCYLKGANLDLVGKIGYATYLSYDPDIDGELECAPLEAGNYWHITSLCCTTNNGCSG